MIRLRAVVRVAKEEHEDICDNERIFAGEDGSGFWLSGELGVSALNLSKQMKRTSPVSIGGREFQ